MKHITLSLAVAATLFTVGVRAQTRGATAEDYFSFETLGDPRFSVPGSMAPENERTKEREPRTRTRTPDAERRTPQGSVDRLVARASTVADPCAIAS
jgi:hypothetical protein